MRALVACLLVAGVAHASPPTPWSLARTPAPGPARAVGGYSAGCIAGAVPLPLAGSGFAVARPERHRVYGHPLLIAMIESLAGALHQLGATLSVGDLGQPRGGPAPSGHASHQTGLDVDLWFVAPHGEETVSMVDAAREQPIAAFAAAGARLVELAAKDPRVERLFVNPVLKRALCESATGERGWLRKVRPWWGHADHLHARLACPADSPACEKQPPLPPGDGCDALAWWFDKQAQAERQKQHSSYSARVGAVSPMPPACSDILAAP